MMPIENTEATFFIKNKKKTSLKLILKKNNFFKAKLKIHFMKSVPDKNNDDKKYKQKI